MIPLSSPPSGACVPGRDGIPSSVIGDLMCGTWLPDRSTAWSLLAHRWQYAAALLAIVIVANVSVRWARTAWWRRATRGAAWLEITPPVTATPDATAQLWRLLVDQLRAPGRLTVLPRRVVFEVHATPESMRTGFWVPPQLTPLAVARAIEQAWPGVRLTQTDPPQLPPARPTVGQRLTTQQPEWLPLTTEHVGHDNETLDPLRAVYGGLAAAGRGGAALMQLVAQRAPRRRLKVAALAGRDPAKAARRRTGTLRAAGAAATGLRAVLRGVLNLVQPGSPSATGPRPPLSTPWQADMARRARAKYASGPHLLIGLRVVAVGETRAAARASVDTVTGGFGLVADALHRRRLRRPAAAAASRWVPEAAMILATVAETAALAALPAEPAAYGMPGAASRRRPGTTDTWRPARRPPTTTKPDDDDPWSYV